MKEIDLNELSYVSGGLTIDISMPPTIANVLDGVGSATWFANTYYPLALGTMVALVTVGGTVIVGTLYIASGLL